jgi:hypothetical protein
MTSPKEYEFEIWQGGVMVVAGGGTDLDGVRRELGHYLTVYAQDGTCEVRGDLSDLMPPEFFTHS